MSLFRKKTPPVPASPTVNADGAPVAESAPWTNGGVLSRRFVSVIVVACLVLSPINFAIYLAAASNRRPAAAVQTSPAIPPLQQAAGAYSVGFVGAWLSASQTDDSGLSAYISSTNTASSGSTKFRDIAAASVTPVAGTDFVQVVVAADIA